MTATDLIREVREAGVELSIVDGRIKARPSGVLPEHLKERIVKCKAELVRLLLPSLSESHSPGYCQFPTVDLEGLRRFTPHLLRDVRIDGQWDGLLWGVTRHGVLVWRDFPRGPIYTLNPDDLELL